MVAPYNLASFRGVEFSTEGTAGENGRKVAPHSYPYRDTPWIEDLGRADRRGSIEGFLIGDDVDDQRTALIAAAEKAGPGSLVHPSRGTLTVTLAGPIRWRETKDALSRVSFRLDYVEGSNVQYPSASTNGQSAVAAAASNASTQSSGGFLSTIQSAAGSVKSTIAEVKATVAPYVSAINSVVGDARMLAGSVTGVIGSVSGLTGISAGRFSLGGLSSFTGAIGKFTSTEAAVTGAISRTTSAVSNVSRLAGAVSKLGNLL